MRFLSSRIIVLVVIVVFSLSVSPSLPSCSPFSRKTDDEREQGASAASIMEEKRERDRGRNVDESERRTCQGVWKLEWDDDDDEGGNGGEYGPSL